MADNDLAIEPQPRVDEACLAVAMCRLVQVHEIHVDLAPGKITIKLGVQVKERFSQGAQPTNPHLGW